MFCTNCHKIDITTGYCSWVEIHPYKKKQQNLVVCFTDTSYSALFIATTDRYSTIIDDDLYLCIELVSMATTYL